MNLLPPPLTPEKEIALIAPATTVKREYVEGAMQALRSVGYRVKAMPHVCGPACGSYASSLQNRLSDLRQALADPQVGAILCARGGYGCVHLLPHLSTEEIAANPKWLIGFSDISALHALWQKAGLISLHAPMAKHLTQLGTEDACSARLLQTITSSSLTLDYELPTSPLSTSGEAKGTLVGGNLAVLSHLLATPYDPFTTPGILFIEDVGEAIYATERMLFQLHLSGVLAKCTGIIIGQFTETHADKNFPSTQEMITTRLREWNFQGPIAADFPAGHIDYNLPLPLGAKASLTISPSKTTLSFS